MNNVACIVLLLSLLLLLLLLPNWLVTATKTFRKGIWGLCRHSLSLYTQTPSRTGKVALHQFKNGIISRVWRAYEDDADCASFRFLWSLPGRWSPQQHLSLSPSHGPSCKWSRKWPITRRAAYCMSSIRQPYDCSVAQTSSRALKQTYSFSVSEL